MPSFMSIQAEMPQEILDAKTVDTRYTFRRTVENRMRPRFNALREEVRQTTIYPAIAQYWKVEQYTGTEDVYFDLINTHRASVYLEAPEGTKPHVIEQEPHVIPFGKLKEWQPYVRDVELRRIQFFLHKKVDKIVINHPGTQPDEPVLAAIEDASSNISLAVDDAISVWMDRFGAKVVGE